MCTYPSVQGGEDAEDASSCRSFSAKEPLIIGLFCGKWPTKIRHPMGLHHSVTVFDSSSCAWRCTSGIYMYESIFKIHKSTNICVLTCAYIHDAHFWWKFSCGLVIRNMHVYIFIHIVRGVCMCTYWYVVCIHTHRYMTHSFESQVCITCTIRIQYTY